MVFNTASVKGFGQYFTPKFIAEFMVKCITKNISSRVLEPSAGTGVFVEVLEKQFSNITAIEIDSSLTSSAETSIQHMNFFDYPTTEKFDVIIGNPPYVRWRNQPHTMRKDITNRNFWDYRLNPLSDMLQAFIFKSIEHLRPGGELIFLTPKFWFETLHATNLRQFVLEHGYIDFIIDFHEKKIFQSVSSNLVIVRFVKDCLPSNHSIKVFAFLDKGKIDPVTLTNIYQSILLLKNGKEEINLHNVSFHFAKHPQTEKSWKLYSEHDEHFINSFEQSCKTNYPIPITQLNGHAVTRFEVPLLWRFSKEQLEYFAISREKFDYTFFDDKKMFLLPDAMSKPVLVTNNRFVTVADIFKIGNGMVSGLDKAFWVEKNPILQTMNLTFNAKERSCIRKVVKARFMEQYKNTKYANYIFIEEVDFKDENDFKEQCPNLYAILVPYKTELANRWSVRPVSWYVWSFPRNFGIFKHYKHKFYLPCKERYDNKGYIRCVYEQDQILGVQDITVLGLYDWIKESPEYILAYLNSTILFQWLMIKGLKRGGVLQFSEHPLTSIPVRLINWKDTEEVRIHDIITKKTKLLIQEQSKNKKTSYKKELEHLFNELMQM